MPTPTWPIGLFGNTDYNLTITVLPGGSFSTADSGLDPLDGVDDLLNGVRNQSGGTVNSITFVRALMFYGDAVWQFDGDGIQQDWGTPAPPGGILPPSYAITGYEGPDNYFGPSSPFNFNLDSYVTVNFPGGIPDGGESFFGTEYFIEAFLDDPAISIDWTPGAVCVFAEDEDDAAPTPTTWPECDLVATRISVKAVSPTVSPGRSLTGLERVCQPDAGSWEIELQDIPINTRDDVLLWRQIESDLNGRANTILVPVYEGKMSGTPIAATANADVAVGAVIVAVNLSTGAAPQPGMQFSELLGQLYRVKSVIGNVGSVYTVKVWPPVRKPITAGDALEFNKPVCRCRLASDDGMNVMLELLTFAKTSVRFLEDV